MDEYQIHVLGIGDKTMDVKRGSGTTKHGPGVDITLTGDEVATAIDAYLVAHGVIVRGPRTIKVNGERCKLGEVYVDPSGKVLANETVYNGGYDQ